MSHIQYTNAAPASGAELFDLSPPTVTAAEASPFAPTANVAPSDDSATEQPKESSASVLGAFT